MTKMKRRHVKLRVEFDTPGMPAAEWLWGVPTEEPGLYEVDNIPFFAYGIAHEDVVRAEPAEDGILEVTGVERPSGGRTLRVLFETDDPACREGLERWMEERGVKLERAFSGMVAFGVGADGPWEEVLEEVFRLQEEGLLVFEDGAERVPGRFDDPEVRGGELH